MMKKNRNIKSHKASMRRLSSEEIRDGEIQMFSLKHVLKLEFWLFCEKRFEEGSYRFVNILEKQ